ncbi:MAG: ImmA/IrrE family metallo-endopeptidase [Planctomycetota bacterium]
MPLQLPVAHLSYNDLRCTAERFLGKFHPDRSIPIPIEDILDLDYGIDIIPTPGLHQAFDMDAFILSDFSTIYVDEFVYKSRPNRYRFSLAHEASHVILHQRIYEKLQVGTIEEWISTVPTISEEQYHWIEWQADALAGLILVPPGELATRFRKAVARASRAGLSLENATDAARHAIADYLARQFEVSSQVIDIRARKDTLWETP